MRSEVRPEFSGRTSLRSHSSDDPTRLHIGEDRADAHYITGGRCMHHLAAADVDRDVSGSAGLPIAEQEVARPACSSGISVPTCHWVSEVRGRVIPVAACTAYDVRPEQSKPPPDGPLMLPPPQTYGRPRNLNARSTTRLRRRSHHRDRGRRRATAVGRTLPR